MNISKADRRKRIHYRIRKKVVGTAARPRLSVFRSNRYIYAQLIDDLKGNTLASASSFEKAVENVGDKSEQSRATGKLLAERAAAKQISGVVFDRGGYLYHGRVKALAEGAREGGLLF